MRMEDLETEEDILRWNLEAINPFGYFDIDKYETPEGRVEKAEKALYVAFLFSAGAWGVYGLTGGGAHNPYHLVQSMRPGLREVWASKQHIYRTVAKGGFTAAKGAARVAPTVAIVTVPVVVAGTGAYYYEKYINEPLRGTSPATSGTWFGPYASGFGPVV